MGVLIVLTMQVFGSMGRTSNPGDLIMIDIRLCLCAKFMNPHLHSISPISPKFVFVYSGVCCQPSSDWSTTSFTLGSQGPSADDHTWINSVFYPTQQILAPRIRISTLIVKGVYIHVWKLVVDIHEHFNTCSLKGLQSIRVTSFM